MESDNGCYRVGALVVFVVVWWWCIQHFWFWGFILGWIPATIAAALWPIALVVILLMWIF